MSLPSSWQHWFRELEGFQSELRQDLMELEKQLGRGEKTDSLLLLQTLTDKTCTSLSHLQVLAVLVAASVSKAG